MWMRDGSAAGLEGSRQVAPDGSFGGWKDFMAPGDRRRFLKHGGNGAIFFLAELDGVFHGGFVKRAAESIENLDFFPDGWRLGGALAGADYFQ